MQLTDMTNDIEYIARRVERPKPLGRISKYWTGTLKLLLLKAEPETYNHQPLNHSVDEIRLLKLHKKKKGPIRCEVQVFPLQHAPEYIALSYRWGEPSPLHDVFIGGKALKIRDILYSCLLELREELGTWLWIDQICIAQSNTAERNHQVGMMARIYSNSASVIVWLSDIPLARPGETDRFNDRELDDASVKTLLENVYFTRVWVLQEILLAKSVKIRINGHRCVTWDRLQAAVPSPQPRWTFRINPVPLYLLTYTSDSWKRGQHMTLMDCITRFGDSECDNPRDKVYGLMGVIREKDRFPMDYSKTVLEVYLDVITVASREKMDRAHRFDQETTLRHFGCKLGVKPL